MRRLLLLATLAASFGAAASGAGNWQSTSPFKLSPTKDRCIAVSSFARGDKKLLVALEGNSAGPGYELRLYAPGSLRRWDDGKFSLGTAKLESDRVDARVGQPGTIIYRMVVSRSELDAAGPDPILAMREILPSGDVSILGLDAAVRMTDACASDLLEHWGYSKEAQRDLAIRPKAKKDWTNYVSSEDYPKMAVYARAGGETRLLIDVGTDGKGSNCRIIVPSGRAELDQMSCRILTERAEYEPGQNLARELVKAPFYAVFRWEMPRPPWL